MDPDQTAPREQSDQSGFIVFTKFSEQKILAGYLVQVLYLANSED